MASFKANSLTGKILGYICQQWLIEREKSMVKLNKEEKKWYGWIIIHLIIYMTNKRGGNIKTSSFKLRILKIIYEERVREDQ